MRRLHSAEEVYSFFALLHGAPGTNPLVVEIYVVEHYVPVFVMDGYESGSRYDLGQLPLGHAVGLLALGRNFSGLDGPAASIRPP